MQYHYVVIYDTEHDRWLVESDTTAYFPDGNIYSKEAQINTGNGWAVADEGSPEEAIDYAALRVLESCIPGILPTPSKDV